MTTSTSITQYDYDPFGTAGTNAIVGGDGADKLFGGSGNDILDGGAGSDDIKSGSGQDLMIYNLSANVAGSAKDIYTGGSGVDTVRLQLTMAEWSDAAVRAQLERYVAHLANVQRNAIGEVANGTTSDFVFSFANGTTLTVQMIERLEVAVLNNGQYTVIDHKASLITGDSAGAVLEAGGIGNAAPGTASVSGDLRSDDLDGADDLFQTATALASSQGYGTYSVAADGVWTYTLDNSHAAVQALNAGSIPLTDSFVVQSVDGATQTVTITINGANDVAVITGEDSGELVEAGGVGNADTGKPTATGDLLSTDFDNANDSFQSVDVPGATKEGYGTYTVTADGVWTYTLDNTNDAVQALNEGGTLSDSFIVRSADGTEREVTVTIAGQNDAARIGGVFSIEMTEDRVSRIGGSQAFGNLYCLDVDNPTDVFQAHPETVGTYGTYRMDSSGVWSYDLDNTKQDVQALNVGEFLFEDLTFRSQDGTEKTFAVRIQGTNDTPVAVSETAIVQENGIVAIDVLANDYDVDSTALVVTGATAPQGKGTVSVEGNQVVFNPGTSFDHLSANDSEQVVVNYGVADEHGATSTGTITITVQGANDAPVASPFDWQIPNNQVGSVDVLAYVTDADGGDSLTLLSAETEPGFGSVRVVNNQLQFDPGTDFASLQMGVTRDFKVTYTVADQHGAESVGYVNVQVVGTNDAPVANLDFATVEERGTVVFNVLGNDTDANGDTLTVTDVSVDPHYGLAEWSADGQLVFTSNFFVNLKAGQNTSATIHYSVSDGRGATADSFATVTITGRDDPSVIYGTISGSATEQAGNGPITPASGDLILYDADEAPNPWTAFVGASGNATLGSYDVTSYGAWTYTPDNQRLEVQKLQFGQTLTDSFTVFSAHDGSSKLITVTIYGADDPATFTGDLTGTVTELAPWSDNPQSSGTRGTIRVEDVDTPNASFVSHRGKANFGDFSIDASGNWSYYLDNENTDVEALENGESLYDQFDVLASDGTIEVVRIKIIGTTDIIDIGMGGDGISVGA